MKSSPLRRVREYQLGCGGSPSPKKVKVRFDSVGKKVKDDLENSKVSIKLRGMGMDETDSKENTQQLTGSVKRVNKLKNYAMVTPEKKATNKRMNNLSSTAKRDKSSLRKQRTLGKSGGAKDATTDLANQTAPI
jgi:hypothetical protein